MNLWKESTKLLFVLEVIGTIAFAISGALVAVEKKMDLFFPEEKEMIKYIREFAGIKE